MLATDHEYCTEGTPFSPFNNQKCCKCQGKKSKDLCGACKKRDQTGSGSSASHHQKVEHLDKGLCSCGQPKGHKFHPKCSAMGTVAYVSEVGEGKRDVKEFAKRTANVTKGGMMVASGQPELVARGAVKLYQEERKAAGDKKYAKKAGKVGKTLKTGEKLYEKGMEVADEFL
eukprot:CAMPEP_0184290740 /NCGR_PEP_ID=MMETSP1049-20130417/2895_1 /TAXON_ID=77928 /ORGANISM="Proteomonas sulcata, Strain CCMP704" /LENGTH=171 /DNA_ID=CAMNT_0026597961 /DNA_START=197 /DNA_END=712 /DNA_ORIENTATION=-